MKKCYINNELAMFPNKKYFEDYKKQTKIYERNKLNDPFKEYQVLFDERKNYYHSVIINRETNEIVFNATIEIK